MSGRIADVLLSSVILRAIETAEIIAPGLGIETFGRECDLCEVHTGVADGLEWAEWGVRLPRSTWRPSPTGCSLRTGRAGTASTSAVAGAAAPGAGIRGRTVVAVCHAGVIQASLRVLLGAGPVGTGARVKPTNTGLTEWGWEPGPGRWTLHSFNETCHLHPGHVGADDGQDSGMTGDDRYSPGGASRRRARRARRVGGRVPGEPGQ